MNNLFISNGNNPIKMTLDLLHYIKPVKYMKKDMVIGIKPNLVCATPASHGATTHPEIVEGIILYFFNNGFKNIKILEGAWIGDSTKRAFQICGYEALSKKYNIPLIDLKDDSHITKTYKGMEINICKTVFDIEYLINVPLIKGHCQTNITCALKNLKGLIPDFEKRRFHTLGLHKPIAYLNKLIRQHLIISDGICPDPYFEEGGKPQKLNRIVAAFDPVLMDSYAAQVLGYKDEDIKYIQIAQQEGVGKPMSQDTEFVHIYKDKLEEINIIQKDNKYLNIIEEADACSSCYSNLANALVQLHDMNITEKFAEQICIGQAYKGYKGTLGVGDCTSCFEKHLPGCPPKVNDIIEFLSDL